MMGSEWGIKILATMRKNDPEDMLKLLSPFHAYFEFKLDRNEMIIFREVKEKKAKFMC